MVSLWLTTPAMAWKLHTTAHLSSPVAVDQHHHHADDGAPIEDRQAPADRDNPGHNHILSGAAMSMATVENTQELAPLLKDAPALARGFTPILRELRRPPPYEPPRAG